MLARPKAPTPMSNLTGLLPYLIPILVVLVLVVVVIGFWQNWIQWFFLCEVQWLAALFLLALPISALTIDKSLVQGAYELLDLASGFYVALAVGLCAVSIAWTAQLEFNLGQDRLQERRPIGPEGWVVRLGVILLVLGVLGNLVVTHIVSAAPAGFFSWSNVDAGLLIGLLVSIGLFIAGECCIGILDGRFTSGKIPPLLKNLIDTIRRWSEKWPSQFKDGYIGDPPDPATDHLVDATNPEAARPAATSNSETDHPADQSYPEIGHLAATLGLIASAIAYFLLGGRSLPPLSCLALLATAFVWLLSGLAFFLQVFRIPAVVPVRSGSTWRLPINKPTIITELTPQRLRSLLPAIFWPGISRKTRCWW